MIKLVSEFDGNKFNTKIYKSGKLTKTIILYLGGY